MSEMKMGYEEFKARMIEEVNSLLGSGERAYCENADDNVLEDCLAIQTGNCPLRFGATFGSLYRAYHSGYSLNQIAEELVSRKEKKSVIRGIEKISQLKDYVAVKADLYARAVSRKSRKQVVERGIYRQFGEIVVGVYLRLNQEETRVCTAMIDRHYLEVWGMTEDEVMEQALDNTMQTAPPRFYSLSDLAFSIAGVESGGVPVEEYCPGGLEKISGCFLSTTELTNGATAVFYPGVAKRICAALDTQAFYIVPTSIHEVAIHDARSVENAEELAEVLKSVTEECTQEKDVLSSHIFKYDLGTDKITEVA